jgi:ELWxxDGT repeat protein
MKKRYLTILAAIAVSSHQANAQTATKIYDHDALNLTQIFNMPYDETRMMVTSGFDGFATENKYYEFDEQNQQLTEITFAGVDTIRNLPVTHENKIFFTADIPGAGRELVSYDGTTTQIFDIRPGLTGSYPKAITFENELYVTAIDLNGGRQLYKYEGGTSLLQISDELIGGGVEQFLGSRGDEYFYVSINPPFRSIKRSVDFNSSGVFTHNIVTPITLNEIIQDVAMLNGEIHLVSTFYNLVDASHRVDRIDLMGNISTNYSEVAGAYSSAHLFTHDDKLFYYRTDPGNTELLDLTAFGTPILNTTLNAPIDNYIAGHVLQNGQMYLYGENFIVNASAGFYWLGNNQEGRIQSTLAYQTDGAFYLYEIDDAGQTSGIIEVDTYATLFTMPPPFIRYDVSTEGASMYMNHPMVMHDGYLTFIFANNENTLSTDIYRFDSQLLGQSELTLESFDLFPNPVSVNGVLHSDQFEQGEYQIVNALGKTVLNGTIQSTNSGIPVNALPAGIYLLQFGDLQKRFVVQD